MDIGSLLLALSLVIIVAAFVAQPLLDRAAARREAASPADDLISQREAVLIELRDLDFDHTTGKIGDDDYAAQRARLVAKGAEVLRALDQRPAADLSSDSTDDDIEKAIAAVRQGKSAKTALANFDDEIEQAVAAVRKGGGKPKAARASAAPPPEGPSCLNCHQSIKAGDKFCPHCGTPISHACAHCGQPHLPNDKFCAKCGAKLNVASEAA